MTKTHIATPEQFLTSGKYINVEHDSVQKWVIGLPETNITERVVALYYRIRDQIRYNPYTFVEGEATLYASFAADRGDLSRDVSEGAYCIPKAALMVAACRAIGVPARLGLANVRNHLSSQKLLDWLGTDLFVMHGYAEVYLNERWVKCTPVFNKDLCEKFGVVPLEFDGTSDSVFHSHTQDGSKHMEYVKDHGTFEDVPATLILNAVRSTYPHIDVGQSTVNQLPHYASLESDVEVS
ncbi:transglutaminase-like domain-containing protein [Aestuariibacter sp. AA17]|uniref:Transglutaminase-like domain-containing protein n=1 Tax=Fluctibacter corallii TaxID=2984329 RepID=A0ABT3A5N8_9ALTE|nr:transglutaminase-like domain-containing protein [Aestuariibacter sp. AA17]MCV2883869.1 transglutaminase-like domain-containing protein [Aestuariibacter sp. AA17]